MAQTPQIFHTSQRSGRAFTWGDVAALALLAALLYAGIRLAFSAPEVIGDLAGFMEHLAESERPRYDIYVLEDELGIDPDQLLRLTETAELLGFASIAKGDIELTPLGQTFAEASILARKEIFAARARRLPMMRWLLNMLRAAEKHRLKLDVIETALSLEFPPELARSQIETLIDWGRYAELLTYDDDAETISLEPEPVWVRALSSE